MEAGAKVKGAGASRYTEINILSIWFLPFAGCRGFAVDAAAALGVLWWPGRE